MKLHDSVKSIEINDIQKQEIDLLRSRYSELFYTIEFLCKTNNREMALAKTKLEESLMWAVKSVSRHPLEDVGMFAKNEIDPAEEYLKNEITTVEEYLKNENNIESVDSNEKEN